MGKRKKAVQREPSALDVAVREYTDILDEIEEFLTKQRKKIEPSMLIEIGNDYYQVCEHIFDSFGEEEKRMSCRRMLLHMLVPIEKALGGEASETEVESLYDLYRKVYAFIARRSLEHFIDFMEWGRTEHKKVYINRLSVLRPFVWYLNKAMFDGKLKKIVTTYPPGYGKSFVSNYFTAWIYGIEMSSSVLRISYSEDLVMAFSRMIKELIASPSFAEVFPSFKTFNGKPFEKTAESDWKIKGADVLVSHIARTRDGQITGSRANKAIIFDDLTKGVEEAQNVDTHRKLYNQWQNEWSNRTTDENVLFIFVGTMWSPEDILNKMVEDIEKEYGELVPSKIFPYCMESVNGEAAVIQVPLLDEITDESTCPAVMSTAKARFKRDTTDDYFFSCVYQQKPIAPSGLEFAWEHLQTYDELPKDISKYSFASLDTARKGKDNCSMPIIKFDDEGYHYLIDTLFEKKPMEDLYDRIVDKIIEHYITNLVIENNIDTSLKHVLDQKLKERGIAYCTISERYSTAKKEQRIMAARGFILRQLKVRNKIKVHSKTNYGKFMQNLTQYSFDYPNKHDDAPDSLALFFIEFLMNQGSFGTVEVIDRSRLRI